MMTAPQPWCFATMFLLTSAPTQQGRSWTTEKALFRVFVTLMLNATQLPLHVLHNVDAEPTYALAPVPHVGRLYFHGVDLIHGPRG